jgi:hypothetical protein
MQACVNGRLANVWTILSKRPSNFVQENARFPSANVNFHKSNELYKTFKIVKAAGQEDQPKDSSLLNMFSQVFSFM